MRWAYLSLLYVLMAWSTWLGTLYVDVGVRIYALDVCIVCLLIPAAFILALRGDSHGRVRTFLAYEMVIALLGVYALVARGNPPSIVAGQVRVFGLYSTTFLISFAMVRDVEDLRAFRRVGGFAICTLLGIVAWRLVTGHGFLEARFSANVNDVRRFASYFEASVLSVYLFWILVRWARRRATVRRWQVWSAALVAGALLVSNYRSVWLAVGCVSAGFLLWEGRRSVVAGARLAVAIAVLSVGVYGVLALGYGREIAVKFTGAGLLPGVSGRLIMWNHAVEAIAAHPWLGNGIGYFRLFEGHIATIHNDPLQATMNVGFIGLLVLAVVLRSLFRPHITSDALEGMEEYSDMRTAVRLSIASMALISLFEPFLLQPMTVAVVFGVLGFETRLEGILQPRAIRVPDESLQPAVS